MTLKQEFIDMITTILDTHIIQNSDRQYPLSYDMAEDSEIVLLPEHDYENVQMWFDSDDDRGELLRIPVDIELYIDELMEGCSDYICFHKKPERPEFKNQIKYINTRKQMMEYVKNIILRLGKRTYEYKKYAKRIMELQDYVVEFVEQVKRDFPIFTDIDSSKIPITFQHDYRREGDAPLYNIEGDCCVSTSSICIRIFDCWRDLEDLKRTVRHELLHYILFVKGAGFNDDSPLFWYFANRYNANPYKTLSEDNQKIYNMFNAAPYQLMNVYVYINSANVQYTVTPIKDVPRLKEQFYKALEEMDVSVLNETISRVCKKSSDMSVAAI